MKIFIKIAEIRIFQKNLESIQNLFWLKNILFLFL